MTCPPIQGTATSPNAVTVELHLVNQYGVPPQNGDDWSSPNFQSRIQNICAAAQAFQRVWSSDNFRTTLEHVPKMVLKKRLWLFPVNRTGVQLYTDLTQAKHIVMTVTVWTGVKGCGLTEVVNDTGATAIPPGYIDQTRKDGVLVFNCGAPPIVPALTNTLAHEYTHYPHPSRSTDPTRDSRDNAKFVSYGIGCLTQDLAFPEDPCKYKNKQW